MIVSVFGPCGIVSATVSNDMFYKVVERDKKEFVSPISINGLPHTFSFWEKYMIVYNCIDQTMYDTRIQSLFMALTTKWDNIPPIQDFMSHFKKMIVDNHIHIIGVVSAYCEDEKNHQKPYVYQILGEEIRRVNIDNKGNINYNCICLEKDPVVGKLLRKVKLRNGDVWEESDERSIRFDLFSIYKSVDFCKFVLKTNHYINNLATVNYSEVLVADFIIVTPSSIEILQKNI